MAASRLGQSEKSTARGSLASPRGHIEEAGSSDRTTSKGLEKSRLPPHRLKEEGSRFSKGAPGVAYAALAALVSIPAVGYLLRRVRQKRQNPGGATALLELGLDSAAVQPDSSLLAGYDLVCSALFNVAGAKSRYAESTAAGSTADAIVCLMKAGADLKGRTVTEELHLGLLGNSEHATNPAAPECGISGCSSGLAAIVASGLADVGLGADPLCGIRVQSALFGMSGFRPTPGQIPTGGFVHVTGSSGSIGWLVKDAALHTQIAELFKLPGALGSFSNTELIELVIASEVFELHGPAGSQLRKIALAAARRWAGADQTASGLLVTYLRKSVQSYKYFVGYDNDEDDVLEGILRAAVTLEYVELLQRHGHLLEEPGSLAPSVLEQLERAQGVCEDEVQAAEQVAAETSRAMRAILKGVILILPTVPSAQPPQGASEEELKQWERGTLQLAALATLTGCPQATIPVPVADGPPLSVSLLSLPKTDQRLAQVAAALCPLVELAASSLAGGSAGAHKAKPSGNQPSNGKVAALSKENAAQEGLKEAGNQAFKAEKFQEAIEKYSLAIKANPGGANSVIFSNRAQALIKVGQFKEAERDCTRALQAGPNAKALLRRGTARAAVSNLDGAILDFKHVLALEPSNRQARMELQNLKQLSHQGLDDVGLGHMLAGLAPGTSRSDISF